MADDPLTFRNNNPGAIEYGPFAQKYGAQSDGRFAVFPDPDTGWKAMGDLLDVYGRRGQKSVSSIINTWAPKASDNNKTDEYIKFVSGGLGVDPNADLTPEQRAQLPKVMAHFEAGKPWPQTTPAASPNLASTVKNMADDTFDTSGYISPDLLKLQQQDALQRAQFFGNRPQATGKFAGLAGLLQGAGYGLAMNNFSGVGDSLAKNAEIERNTYRGLASQPDQASMLSQMLKSPIPGMQQKAFDILAQANDPAHKLDIQLKEAQLKAANVKPLTFGDIGPDQFGQMQKGWIDPTTQTVKPIAPGAAAGGLPPGSPPLSLPTGDDFLKTLPKPQADQIKAISEGRIAFPSGFALKTPYWQAMVRAVSQYDPSFDAVNYNARAKTRADFTAGKSAQNITAFNTAIQHLDTLDTAVDKLDNSGLPLWNKVANAARQQYDPSFAAKVKQFEAARTAVTDELTRAFRGAGGNVHDIQEWEKTLSSADSPEALHAAVKQAIELLHGRIEAVSDQYNRGMGTTKDPLELLSPKAQTAVKRMRGDVMPGAVVPPAGAAPSASNAAPVAPTAAPTPEFLASAKAAGIPPDKAAAIPEGGTITSQSRGVTYIRIDGKLVDIREVQKEAPPQAPAVPNPHSNFNANGQFMGPR